MAVETVSRKLQNELYPDTSTIPNNPTYRAEPEILGRYGERAIEVLKRHDSEVRPLVREFALRELNAEPYERNLKVVIGELPTVYGIKLGFVQKGGFLLPVVKRVPVGKVFGRYEPDTDTLTLHYGIFPEFANDDPDKAMLENTGVKYQLPKDIIAHERTHRLQHETGALNKYNLRAIEGIATVATEYLLRKPQKVYRALQPYAKKLIEKFGFKNTFRGDVPTQYRTAPNPVPN